MYHKTPRRKTQAKHSLILITLMFLRSVSQGKTNKNKSKQVRSNQTYMPLYSKGNHKQSKNTTYRMGLTICKRCYQQGLNFQNIQTAHTTQQQKNKQPDQKMGRGPK